VASSPWPVTLMHPIFSSKSSCGPVQNMHDSSWMLPPSPVVFSPFIFFLRSVPLHGCFDLCLGLSCLFFRFSLYASLRSEFFRRGRGVAGVQRWG